MHARRSPKWVGPAHVADQLANLRGNAWATRPQSPTPPRPVASEAGTVPTHYGVGFDDHEDLRPVGPESAQEHPKATVQIRELWPFHRALEHGELLPKSEILERQRAACFERRDEGAQKQPDHDGDTDARRRERSIAKRADE